MKLFATSLCFLLFPIVSWCMEKDPIKINGPFFNEKKHEYYVEACIKEQIIGSATYYPYRWNNRWYLSILEVDPPYQKKGIATQLLAACIEHTRNSRASALEWCVLPRNIGMTKAQLIRIYHRMLNKIDAEILTKTSQEERGDENLSRTFLVVTFD